MAQKLCIIHANCQGDILRFLLEMTPVFAQEFTIQKYTNYLQEDIPLESLQSCHLFLYQSLGYHWGEHATQSLLQKLPSTAKTLEIPNMFFNGYWPLWTNKTTMAYGDMLLEELCSRDLSPVEILHIYLKGKLSTKFDIDALCEQSRQKEVMKERHQPIKTMEFIKNNWQKEQLFHTVNHPAPTLSLYVAEQVLEYLGFEGVSEKARQSLLASEEECILPIHPQVVEFYNLAFVKPEQRYPMYGQRLSFSEYTMAYIQCRLQKGPDAIEDFIVYLHLLAQRAQQHGL